MILPRPAGEGDREAVEGATASSMLKVSFKHRGIFAPSTTLRAVPLPLSATLLGGGSYARASPRADDALPAKTLYDAGS